MGKLKTWQVMLWCDILVQITKAGFGKVKRLTKRIISIKWKNEKLAWRLKWRYGKGKATNFFWK